MTKIKIKQRLAELKKSGTAVANKSANGEAHQEAQPKKQKLETKMNALIPSSKVGKVSDLGSLVIALFAVSAAFYVVLSGGSLA